jgi:hypothetical protein
MTNTFSSQSPLIVAVLAAEIQINSIELEGKWVVIDVGCYIVEHNRDFSGATRN